MIMVLYREGDAFSMFGFESFSVDGCLEPQGMTIADCQPQDENDATDLYIQHFEGNVTIVTYSNSDGECRNWIGPSDQFTNDPLNGVAIWGMIDESEDEEE